MKVYRVPVQGVFVTNSYFVIDEATKHGFLVDCGAQGKDLAQLIRKQGWTIEKLLLTHGHFDHTGGIAALEKAEKIPVWCHVQGPQYLKDPVINLSRACGPDITVQDYQTFRDGDSIRLEANPQCQLQVIHTPGHTRDSVTFYDKEDQVALVGDTIFKGACGSTEYPTGDAFALRDSLQKVLSLPDETVLLSGHSDPTTVGAERPYYR